MSEQKEHGQGIVHDCLCGEKHPCKRHSPSQDSLEEVVKEIRSHREDSPASCCVERIKRYCQSEVQKAREEGERHGTTKEKLRWVNAAKKLYGDEEVPDIVAEYAKSFLTPHHKNQ